MSELTQAETDVINDTFWRGGRPACPRCGAVLRVIVSNETRYPTQLVINCVSCGLHQWIESAPEAGGDIADEQALEMVALYLRDGLPVCPEDGTAMKVEEMAVCGPTPSTYDLRCPRCGAHGQVQWRQPER